MADKLRCPECGSDNIVKAATTVRARKRIQRYRCKDCERLFVEKGEASK